MAGGLAALLDDVAMIARMASAASTRAVGVVVDDAAVTPQFVTGISPKRELPMIWRIAKGSLRNKLVFILPLALILSQYVPWLLNPILMVGGAYLCFEGAEKILEYLSGKHAAKPDEPVRVRGEEYENQMVKSAITTDFVLSAEIMVISLNEVADAAFWPRLIVLVIVALVITGLVYGVVAIIVKMDDVGLRMTQRDAEGSQRIGKLLLVGMPKLLSVLSVVGVIAMLWVGGHIIVAGVDKFGWHTPLHVLHLISQPAAGVAVVGGFLAWLIDALLSAVVGLILGAVIVGVWHLLPWGKHRDVHAPNSSH